MTSLHMSTFDYFTPTTEQMATMKVLREASREYAMVIELHLPDNPDRTYLLRKLREVAMWANICATRHSDGCPRGMEMTRDGRSPPD